MTLIALNCQIKKKKASVHSTSVLCSFQAGARREELGSLGGGKAEA